MISIPTYGITIPIRFGLDFNRSTLNVDCSTFSVPTRTSDASSITTCTFSRNIATIYRDVCPSAVFAETSDGSG